MLTKGEEILIRWMKAIGMSEDDTVGVILALETPEQQDMLAEFLSINRDATDQDVLKETLRILRLTNKEEDI